MSYRRPTADETERHTEGFESLYNGASEYGGYTGGRDPTYDNNYGQQASYYSNFLPGEADFGATLPPFPAAIDTTNNPILGFDSDPGYPLATTTTSYDYSLNH